MLYTSQQIIDKYKLTNKQLVLHYTILGGEMPSNLISSIVSYGTWKWIVNKSDYKDFFKYIRGNHHQGFQLSRKAKDEIKELPYDYTPYLLHGLFPSQNTNEINRRMRYQMRTRLFYYLDELQFNYIEPHLEATDYNYYDIRQFKTQFTEQGANFARKPSKEFQIQSSRALGILKIEEQIHIVYAFEDRINIINPSTELRLNVFIKNTFNTLKSGDIIFTLNSNYSISILKEILYGIVFPQKKTENTTQKKKLSFFRKTKETKFHEVNYCGMRIMSFDETGQYQMLLFKNKEKTDKLIRNAIKAAENRNEVYLNNETNNYNADGTYNNLPCYFLYDLNVQLINKIIKSCTMGKSYRFSVVAFEEHIIGLKEMFRVINTINKDEQFSVDFIPIQELKILDEVNIK